MRRLWILMVAALAVASVPVFAGAAQAARGSKFCDTANRAFDDLDDVDPGDFDLSEDQIDDVLDSYKELEKQAPKKLRKPYRTLRKYYQKLARGDFDITDTDDIEELVEQGPRVARAGAKIYNYLVDECGLDLPDVSVPDVSLPDVSIPDISIPDISIPELDG